MRAEPKRCRKESAPSCASGPEGGLARRAWCGGRAAEFRVAGTQRTWLERRDERELTKEAAVE
ncbi:MAG: hypothetical protein ACREX4_25350, partial [Gammaproteobacteria bacterium]